MKILVSQRDERGFTFIELMIALLLMSILFLGVWGIFTNAYTFWRQAEYKVDIYDNMRVALDRMGRELMFARGPDSTYPASGYPGGVLIYSNNSHLYFEIDGTPPKKIHYYCSSYNLYRQVNNDPAQPLASDIQSVAFTYYDSTGEEVNPTSIDEAKRIRTVKIVLTAKKQGSTLSPVVLVQKISLRSL